LPRLNALLPFSKMTERSHENLQAYICTQAAGNESLLNNRIHAGQNVLLLIGPEGDFSDEELKSAKARTFVPVSLGESRLRTETAGVVACTIASLVNSSR